jgi:hypothetical protein
MSINSYIYFGPLVKCSEQYDGDADLYELLEERLTEVQNCVTIVGPDVWIPNVKGYGYDSDELEEGQVFMLSDASMSRKLREFEDHFSDEIDKLREFYTSIKVDVGLVKYWF